jgi:hypothetical protein
MRKATLFWMMVLGFLVMVATASPSLAAYSAHQNDQDVNNFLTVYPFAKSTKLDDCSLCHPGGQIKGKSYGSCDYCHQTYTAGSVPLNSYGQDYMSFDRSEAAFRVIDFQNKDSDGDGTPNSAEITALTFPGNAEDHPGLVPAPAIGMNLERLLKLPDHSQFLFLNASNSRDFYARYRGIKILDLLKYAGISKNATQITVYSPDGYSMAFPIDVADPQTDLSKIQYDVIGPYPYGTYYGGLDFVDYGIVPQCIDDGERIPDKLYMLLAYMRDGDLLTPGKLNASFKLDGEGPYRLVPPQKIAGSPDRGCKDKPVGDSWDCDSNKNHNAGSSARTVAAIRVDPLPDGTTDFNWYEGGWNLVDKARLVIYGAINPRTYPVSGKVSDSSSGKGVPDVKVSFSLLSLGNVGEATTSSAGGHFKKWVESGKFRTSLPAGEYTVVPSKEKCTFTPASLLISLPDEGCDPDCDRWKPWDRSPEVEIKITATCTP